MHITTSELTILGVAGTLVGTWLGSFLNRGTAKSVSRLTIAAQQAVAETTLTAQRRLAEDQRLWSERKDTYIAILTDAEQRIDFRAAVDSPGVFENDPNANYDPTLDEWRELNVRVTAFGSETVRQLLNEAREAHLEWGKAYMNWKVQQVENQSMTQNAGPSTPAARSKSVELTDHLKETRDRRRAVAERTDEMLTAAIRLALQGTAIHD